MCDSPLTVNSKSPKYVNGMWTTKHPVSCGKCPPCRKTKVRQWIHRILQQDKISICSHFITLTYNNECVPLTKNNMMTLDTGYRTKKGYLSNHLIRYMKRLRKMDNKSWKEQGSAIKDKPKITYYAVGEYGDKSDRPHYHLIIFNVYDSKNYEKAWKEKGRQLGSVHIGNTTGASVAYCMKYLDKTKGIPKHVNDLRLKEFSFMSKGIGKNYLTPARIKYHKEDLSRYYIKQDGYKIKMPKYYASYIYTDDELKQISKIQYYHRKKEDEKMEKYIKKYYNGSVDLDTYKDWLRLGRYNSFKNQKTKRDVSNI